MVKPHLINRGVKKVRIDEERVKGGNYGLVLVLGVGLLVEKTKIPIPALLFLPILFPVFGILILLINLMLPSY